MESPPALPPARLRPASPCLIALVLSPLAWAQAAPGTLSVRELPDALRQQWQQTQPEMLPSSRCAAAFDSHSDWERMTLKCSVHIKLGAEGERRALRYCEEDRQKKRIHSPCKIVQAP